jgi:hypothetical protein
MTTAAEVIKEALHLFGITDQTEDPTATDIANNVKVLNTMLRSDHMDGAAQYLMNRVTSQLPAGSSGSIYSFLVGAGKTVDVDAVAIKALWCNDISPTVNRETRQAPISDVVRTTFPGIITKWHQERQVDGSIRVTAWQPPANSTPVLIEYGGRIPALTAVDGSDEVELPPEGIHDVTLMLGRRVMGTYGRSAQDVGIVLQDSEAVHQRWKDWARGQQWLRMVRS